MDVNPIVVNMTVRVDRSERDTRQGILTDCRHALEDWAEPQYGRVALSAEKVTEEHAWFHVAMIDAPR